jgi:hypothetical protein
MASKDWLILKITMHADKRLLKKWHESPGNPCPQQHIDRAQSYTKLKEELFTYVTGKPIKEWIRDYYYNFDCLKEYIAEHHNIHFYYFSGGSDTYMLGLDDQKTYDFLIEKCIEHNLPYKKLKRAHTYWADNYEVETTHRDIMKSIKEEMNKE